MTPPQREASQGRDDDLKELWEDFRSSSTLHGFFRASEAKFSVRRITWLVALLAACVVLVLQLTNNIKEWRKYEVLYGTEIRNSHRLPFPAVSICNQNMMRKSKILGKNGQRYLDHLRSAWNESTEDEQSAPEAPFDVEKEIRAAGHQLSEMLIGCMFNMKPCSAEDFVPFLDFWVSNQSMVRGLQAARFHRGPYQPLCFGCDEEQNGCKLKKVAANKIGCCKKREDSSCCEQKS